MIDRSKAPSIKDNIDFNFPILKKIDLMNGIKVHPLVKNDLPMVQIHFMFSAGSALDKRNKAGTASLLSLLIDEGAGQYNSLEISDEFDKLGIITSWGAEHDIFYASALTLSEHLERAIELIALILKEPRLSEKDFEREHNKLSTQLIQSQAQPAYLANVLFHKMLLKNSIYELPSLGTKQTVDNTTLEDVKNFYNDYITPKNLDIVSVGNIYENDLIELINKYFSDWNLNGKKYDLKFQHLKYEREIFVIDKPGSAQSEIRIGHLTGPRNSENYLAKAIVNSILGGQFTSRLNSNLRENKGYTYGIRSSIVYNKLAGFFEVSTSVDSANTFPAIKEIMFELNRIKEGVKPEEIEFTKSYLIRRYPSLFETYFQTSKNIINAIVHNLSPDYYLTYIDGIRAVSNEEIQTAAQNEFKPEQAIVVVVGDRKIFQDELENLDGFKVTYVDEDFNTID